MKIIKFEQERCNPCKMVANYLNDKGVKHTVYDVMEDFEETERYFIMSTPVTILLDDNGEEIERVVGFNPDALDELVSKLN